MDDMQVFDNGIGGKLRAGADEQGQLWFAAADVAAALGYSSAKDLTRNLDDDEKGRQIVPTPGGDQELSTITEPGLYHSLNMRRAGSVKDDATRSKVKAFQHAVNHDVLPAIRRDGGYMVAKDETPEETMARAVLIANSTIERQKARIAEMEPKAFFADSVSQSSTSVLVGVLAKLLKQNGYDTGQNRLFKTLCADGFLIGTKGRNYHMPTQRAADMGLFEVKESTRTHSDGHTSIERTTLVTGKGQVYFINRYCREA